jgi:phage terminase large subunit-like protein
MTPARVAPAGVIAPSVRIERFFTRHLRHVKGEYAGEPFELEPWQRDELVVPIFDELRRDGPRLVRRVSEALAGVPKKNGKSTLAAGLGAYGLFHDGYYVLERGEWRWRQEAGAEVFNIAGSKDQAKVLFQIGTSFVERSPMLSAQAKIYRDAIENRSTGGVWKVLASDARLAHGPNPSLTIIDELWTHKTPELYEAFASAGAARRQPLVIVITTAGWDKATIAHAQYRRGLTNRDRSFYFRWYGAPEGAEIDDHDAWRAANPSRWVTIDYLEGELRRARALGLEAQFRRWHLNEWSSGKEIAIPTATWERNRGRPRIPDGAPVVIGVDTAPKRDSTAIAIDYRDPAGIHHLRVAHMVADPETGYLDYLALEDLLRDLCRRYDVTRILVDPYNMVRSMLELLEEGLPIEEFPQHDSRMVPASMGFFELLNEGRIRHGGTRELREQAANASKRTSERGWRFQKSRSAGVIDGIIAAAIAVYEAERGFDEEAPPLLVI